MDIFLISAQNIDRGYTLEPPRRGGSNEYPQSMFWSKNKKNRYTPANPSFTKVGFTGVFIARTCFPDGIGENGDISNAFFCLRTCVKCQRIHYNYWFSFPVIFSIKNVLLRITIVDIPGHTMS